MGLRAESDLESRGLDAVEMERSPLGELRPARFILLPPSTP
jgi:hypothetical protein